jgi:YidC/Oxa1 family membrane protein insertase
MDRNQIIGITLISVLFMVYVIFWGQEPPAENQALLNSATVETLIKEQERTAEAQPQADSLVQKLYAEKYGIFAAGGAGREEEVVLENKDIQVTLSTKGGNVKKVLLKNYFTYDKKPLYLIDEQSSKIALNVATADNREINLSELYFNKSADSAVAAGEQRATFILPVGDGQYVEQVFSLAPEGFQLNYDLNFVGLERLVKKAPIAFNWVNHLQKIEYDVNQSRDRSTVNYYLADGTFDNLTETSRDLETEKLDKPVKWVALKQKFFNSALIAQNSFAGGNVSSKVEGEDTTNIKELETVLYLPIEDVISGKGKYQYFFGPNDFDVCKQVTVGFEENVNLGWPVVKWINRFVVVPVFHLLESFTSNYGVIIIILVILLKLVLLPLSYKSYISMAKMKVMKPELDELKEKHGGDMQKVQAEQMQLYQKVGINPLSGCIPMLLQMPILFAMFSFFPNAIQLRQESFLWATDLSSYDHPIHLGFTIPFYGSHVSIFTLLMTVSTLIYTWFNNQMSTAVQGPMKAVSYSMPVVFMFVLNSFPAGLSFYYFMSNVVTILQQMIIKRFVDEDALRAKLDENKKNFLAGNTKKSKFMQRLDDAMKAQEELKKQKDNKNKK